MIALAEQLGAVQAAMGVMEVKVQALDTKVGDIGENVKSHLDQMMQRANATEQNVGELLTRAEASETQIGELLQMDLKATEATVRKAFEQVCKLDEAFAELARASGTANRAQAGAAGGAQRTATAKAGTAGTGPERQSVFKEYTMFFPTKKDSKEGESRKVKL